MNQREKFKRLIHFFASSVMVATEVALFAYIWYTRYSLPIGNAYSLWRRGHWAVIGIYALIILLLTKTFGGFSIGYLRNLDVVLSNVLSIIISNIVAYLLVVLVTHEYMTAMPLVKLTILDFILIIGWTFLVRAIMQKLYPPRQMIVVYGKYSPRDLISKINTRKDKYNICASINISAGIERIKEEVTNYEAVVICDVPSQVRNVILKYCFDNSIRTYVTPKISDIMIRGGDSIHLFDTPLILSRNHGLSIEDQFGKRIMDIVFSLIALIIFSPFMLLSALLIKCYDGGPVFYHQDRLTIDGKVFRIIKFRSMCVDSEKQGARLAKKNDDRITPIGRFLRNIHFDEIPQLFNILKGEMSFVGPRPERPEIAEEYMNEIPEFNYRLKVKAGLTGYAQVYGKYSTTPYDKLKLDMTYIMNYTIWLDMKLLIMTFKIIFQKEVAEGVDNNQKTASKKK
ncbi:MAG: sugar transferase [bacterium]|nr:sugar transferase [bacterium]